MSDKIIIDHTTSGLNLYAIFRDSNGDHWNGSTFENFTGGNYGNYDVALSEWGTTASYRVAVPAFAAGRYSYKICQRAGASPAQSDANVGSGEFSWDGSEVADNAQIIAHGNTNWATLASGDIAGEILASPSNKLVTNSSGEVKLRSADIDLVAAAVWAVSVRTLSAATNITAGIAQAVWEYATRVLTAGTNLPTAASITTAVWASGTRTLTALGFSLPWNADWDAEVQSEVQDAIEANHLDHLLAASYNPASKPGHADALLNKVVESDAGVPRFTENSLEMAPSAALSAAAVWDALLANHEVSGSFGEALHGAAIAESVMDATVDGSVDVRAALKAARAAAIGKIVRTDTDPPTFAVYNAAGDTVIATLEFAADGSERDAA